MSSTRLDSMSPSRCTSKCHRRVHRCASGGQHRRKPAQLRDPRRTHCARELALCFPSSLSCVALMRTLMPRLKECLTAVIARSREELEPETLIIGGRSMGGRAASMLAADGFDCDGLLLLAYPLHPPGKPEQLRDAHLPAIKVPVICFNGTRDPFCTPSLMEEVLKRVTTDWEMHWVEGADHSFHVLKSSGKTDGEVLDSMADICAEWVRRIG